MALRILTYTGLAYEALLQRGDIEADGTLPPVLPFVVHGGATPWSAPLDVSDLIARVDAPLARFQPSNRYALLDEIGTTTDDLPRDNLAAARARRRRAMVGPAAAGAGGRRATENVHPVDRVLGDAGRRPVRVDRSVAATGGFGSTADDGKHV